MSPGLHVIFDPANQAEKSNAEIDIVAVHGLNFLNKPDHAKATWSRSGKLWLSDFLPSRLPKPSRVMLFEYNSSPAIEAAALKLDDHAASLLQWLDIRRKECSHRPLIFISHSLGGLVVKEALVHASLNDTYKAIVESTRLLVFFATPHQGGNYASVGDAAAAIARAVLRNPRNDLVEALKSSSNEVVRRSEQFRHLTEKFLVVSFFEGQPYKRLGVIVDKRSASLNLAGTREKIVPIDADHSLICKFSSIDDGACELVIETIVSEIVRGLNSRILPMETSQNIHWWVPRSVNPLFTGREEVLQRIERSLMVDTNSTKQQRRFVITGMGGQGKSEICLKVADLVRERFWGVFWIDASTENTALASYRRVSDILGAPSQDIKTALHLLSNTRHDWLIILDNADDKDTDYSQYFPSGTRGAILMTSRIPDSRRYCTVGTEQLQSLDSSNCSNLLLRAAEIPYELWNEHEAAAERVISALGSHTLALIQAGAYISQGYCSIKSYPEEYQRQCKKLMEFSPKQAESRYCNVYATFEASAQVLEASNDEASRDALDLLNLLSIFHNEKVPLLLFEDAFLGIQDAQELPDDDSRIEILSTWHVSHLPQFMQVDLEQWDQFRLQRAQTLLRSLALITAGEERSYPTISMHPLTHNWSSTRQERNLTQSLKSIGCLYALLAYGKREIVPYETPLRLHLQKFINQQMHSEYNTSTSMKTSQVLYQCCQLLHYLRLDVLLTETLGILFQRLKLDPREPTERFLQLYKLGANNLYYMGKSKQAVVTWEKIIEIENTTLADDHERRLESEHQLSVAYIYNQQFKDAITLLEHIVKVRETLREDHPNRLSAQHVLALAHVDNGQIKDAINLLEHVVKVQTTIAEDHPDRLASQYVLAKAYLENGQIKGAINLLEHIVKVRETTLAEDHPERLSSQHALGTAYLDNGRIKDGIRLLEQVVKVETILAEGDPDRLLSQHTLARAYLDNGQIKDAINLLKHVVKVRETTLTEDNPERLSSQHVLGKAYLDNGQIKDAINLLEHIVKVETILAEDHRVTSQHELARAYLDNRQIKDAINLLEHVVKINETTLAEDHRDRLSSQNVLGRAYLDNGQIKDAINLLEYIVKVETVLTEDNPDRLSSQYVLGRAYLDNGQIKDAISLLEHVVKVGETTLAEDHRVRLSSQHELARAYLDNGQIKDATKLQEHVVKVRKKTLPDDHASRLGSERLLSRAYEADKRIDDLARIDYLRRGDLKRGFRMSIQSLIQRSRK